MAETAISTAEIKNIILRLLKEDEEFRLAVAGLLGLNTILEELKKLREDFNRFAKIQEERWEKEEEGWRESEKRFNEFVKAQEERWEEAFEMFSRLELLVGAMAGSMYANYLWDDLREEFKVSGESVLEKGRRVIVDNVEVDMLIVTDRNIYVIEVKVKPDIGDVGALLARAEFVSAKYGKPVVPVLAGALIGGDVRGYAESKGVKVYSY
ncbi:MAG: hypothetical protein ACK4H7_03340 [Acidilobaceae archaeon]